MSADSTACPEKGNRSAAGIFTALALVAVCLFGYGMRCLHLLRDDHYYIVSPDSYFFHWQAQKLLSGESIPLSWHGGLTYPLAWAARAISAVSGTSEAEALRWAGLALPPLLGVLTIVLLYVLGSRLYSRHAGLFAGLVWAAALMPVFMGAAGYLDRDGVSVLLVVAGIMIYYDSRNWRIRARKVEVGWVVGVLAVLAVEAVLFAEWMYMGPLIFLVIVGSFWAAEVTVAMGRSLYRMAMKPGADILVMTGRWLRLLWPTLWRSDWRRLILLICLNVAAIAVVPGGLGLVFRSLTTLAMDSLAGAHAVSELSGMSWQDLLVYQLFLLPTLAGLYLALKRGRRADALIVGWFLSLFAIGIYTRRVFFFAAPAICILSGIGLAGLVDLGKIGWSRAHLSRALSYDWELLLRYSAAAVGVLLLLLSILVSMTSARGFGKSDFVSANNDWEAGLEWLEEETPADAWVMTHWNYGYFILDLADRRPVVDNGLYNWDEQRNRDIALAYCTTEPAEAVRIMKKQNADYLIFSELEYTLLPLITKDALGEAYGDGVSIPPEMRDSLYARALSGQFTEGGGLRRVYPKDPSTGRAPLVILGLE